MTAIKIAIATPAHGETFYAPYVQSIIRLQRLVDQRGWQSRFATISYADLVEARNYLLTHWFDDSDATHLLFVDADMGFDPKLISEMIAFDKPVVGAIYPKRQIDLNQLAERAAKGESAQTAIASAHDFIYRPLKGRMPKREKGFIEVEACGTGLMLIQRSCVATMLKKLPELSDESPRGSALIGKNVKRLIRAFDNLRVDGARLSEDYAFCHRWRTLCGGEIWANTQHRITHVGLRHFDACFSDARKGPRIVLKTRVPTRMGAARSKVVPGKPGA